MKRHHLPIAGALLVLTIAGFKLAAQEGKGESDSDAVYRKLLETIPSLKEKVESGGTSKEEVLEWFRKTKGGEDAKEKRSSTSKMRDTRGTNFPPTAFEYAKKVEPDLGVPPKVNLSEAVEIPIYVNGKKTLGKFFNQCDNPTLLGKGTSSGSMIQRYEGRTADGKPLPDVLWVAFARHSPGYPGLGSVQMIGYNKKTGATAFFESCDALRPWVKIDPRTTRMTGVMPWIDEPDEFNQAFVVPGRAQCVQCHQNEPFITDPFINAAKIPGTDESVVPALDKDAPYYVIGGEDWDMRTIHIEGNACFDCHRVGMETMKLFMSNGWDPNKHMPPHDPGSLADDLRELLNAWALGPEKVPAAEWVIPPARGEKRRIVGKDYPHKAWFNRPSKLVVGGSAGPAESRAARSEGHGGI